MPPAETRTEAPPCHFIITRRDLPLGPLAAQVAHAAGNSSPGNLPEHTIAVVLGVPDEPALESVAKRLTLAGAEFVRIVEDDAPYHGQLMAIGCKPGRKEVIGRSLSGLPLLR